MEQELAVYNKAHEMQLDDLVQDREDLRMERDALLRERTALQNRHLLLEAELNVQCKAW